MGEIILDYPAGNHSIPTVFIRGRRKTQSEEKKAVSVMAGGESRVIHFEEGGRGHKLRNTGGP